MNTPSHSTSNSSSDASLDVQATGGLVQPLASRKKKDVDYVFYELTRSICLECRRVIDAHILLRDNKVYMRKRCPEHGLFEGLVYGDAKA